MSTALVDFVLVRYQAPVVQAIADIEDTVPDPKTITIIDNTADNRGWTVASDDAAMMGQAPLICFLNPDVRLKPGWLEPVREAFEDPEVVIAGPCSVVPSACEWWGIGEDMVAGWLLVVRRAWYEFNRLDRRFFLMFADTDLNRRALEDGKSIAYLDGLPVQHETRGYEAGGAKAAWMAEDGARYRTKWGIPEPQAPTVGSVTIYRDENLARLVGSLSGAVVDMAVFVNTNPDASVKQAADAFDWLGWGYPVSVGWFPWCDDFAAARNVSIEQSAADWLIWLDADDVLVEDYPGALKNLVDQMPSSVAGLVEVRMMCDDGSVGATCWQKRVFRNGRGHHFEGRIHEQLVGPTKSYQLLDVHVEHWGYAESDGRKQQKSERNRRLLEMALKDEPDNAFYRYQLGMQLLTDDLPRAALDEFAEALAHVPPEAGYGALLYTSAVVAAGQLDEWPEAARIGARCPERWTSAGLLFNLGVAWNNLGAKTEARRCFWRAIRGQYAKHEGDPSCATWRPWHALALMAQAEGRMERARGYVRRAMETGAREQEGKDLAEELKVGVWRAA